jgi:hypothetical protein
MLPPKPSKRAPSRANAEALAAQAFAFLAAEPERIGRFLSLTGLTPERVRGVAGDPAFLPSVLDYLLSDEALLLAFAAESGIEADAVPRARIALDRGKD